MCLNIAGAGSRGKIAAKKKGAKEEKNESGSDYEEVKEHHDVKSMTLPAKLPPSMKML